MKHQKKAVALVSLFSLAFAVSCSKPSGTRVVKSKDDKAAGQTAPPADNRDQSQVVKKDLNVEKFDSVEVSGGLKVLFKQSPNIIGLLECNQNSLDQVKAEMDGTSLKLTSPDNFNAGHAQVTLSSPNLKSVSASGFATMNLVDVAIDTLNISANDSCTIEGSGSVKKLTINGQGKAFLKLGKLVSEDCTVAVNGKAFAKVNATKTLNATSNGSAVINLVGNPKITKNIAPGSFFKMAE